MSEVPFLSFLHLVCERRDLSEGEAERAMARLLKGEVPAPLVAAFLAALRTKGETEGELVGFARAMRAAAVPVDAGLPPGEPLLDTCGTGGDGMGTVNLSTAAALVVAGAGVRVAKHGNRSLSSQCGSADVLEALGVHVGLTAPQMAVCLREVGIAFLFAPTLHPAVRHVQEARRELRMRTAFNLLGPLANPAQANCQLVGAPSLDAARQMAAVLAALGLERGLVVHAANGLDEISPVGETHTFLVEKGRVTPGSLHPHDFGLEPGHLRDLTGGTAVQNAAILRAILRGEAGGPRNAVLLNAAAALVVADRAATWREALHLAAASIDGGAALALLERWAALTHQLAKGGACGSS